MATASYVNHKCSQCGGDVVFDREATGTRCKYCGAGLVVLGARSSWLNFLLKPAITVRETSHVVTQIAIKNNWKPPLLRSVIPFYFPFFRTSGHALKWVRGERPDQQADPGIMEKILTRYVDLMRPAHLDLSPGLFSPGYRAQTLNLYLATKNNAGKIPFLPVQKEREDHGKDMQEAFFDGMADPDLRVREERFFRLWECDSTLFFPLYLVEVREGTRIRLLLLDAIGASLIRQIGHEEMEKLLDNLGLVKSQAPRETRLKLAPLICPECAGDLDSEPMALVRFCRSCGRGWEAGGSRLRERECLWAEAKPQARDASLLFLPFWRRESGSGVLHIPAFEVHSPQLLYNLSVRYYKTEFPAQPIPYENRLRMRSLPVGLPSTGADEMAGVVAGTGAREGFTKKGSRQSLLLVPFRRRGPDLVEPFMGLAIPVSSLSMGL